MPISELAPLAVEKMIVASILVFATAGLVGLAVGKLQRRYQITNGRACVVAILASVTLIALQAIFQLPEHLAPVVQPYMWVFKMLSFAVTVLFGTLCLYSLFGGKISDLAALFKRR